MVLYICLFQNIIFAFMPEDDFGIKLKASKKLIKCSSKGPSTLVTLFNHIWPRIVAGIFIPVGNHYVFSSFGEHTALCGSSVRHSVARPRHRQSVCIHNIHVAATCRPSVLGSATMRGHMWLNKVAAHCSGDIYSRRKPLFSNFGEHTAVCGSSVRQAVARPSHRQSVFVAAFCVRSEHTCDCSCGLWQPLRRVGNFAEYACAAPAPLTR